MKKQINEASVRIDVQGLESNDLETLSRMLALAGQAENKGPQLGGMASIPAIRPLDMDSIGGDETQAIMSPETSPSADDMSGVGGSDLGAAVGDLAGSITDFGDEGLDNGMGSDVESMEVQDESSPDFGSDDISSELDSEYTGDDDFDMGRMSSLAGIHESQDVDDSDDVSDDSDDEVNPDDQSADEETIGESLLPDLSLDEDAISPEEQPNQEFGPFRTEFECVNDGQEKTNGVEGDNFIVVPKGNAFYWKRTVQEDADNRPEPDFYDDEGIRNSRHEYRNKRTALGDNPILSVDESEEDDESVDSIFESINDKYKKFMEGL
ncbi:putative structural protein [Erwinia phage pEa_SNUABM_47]|uniref:Putative structural protein n=1 Tax=Erwinia phage pEa_SNUABM_47 TaxID=2768774 RepID=A0A7L8ZNG2_9CAUD|nr:putative structural protein [Erwinia phage pEa_SNUABM_47]